MRASRDPERERQLAGVEGAEAPRPRGGVAMIEEVEIGGLPGARLPAHEPLGRPAIDGVARCAETALLHVGRGIEPTEGGRALAVATRRPYTRGGTCKERVGTATEKW